MCVLMRLLPAWGLLPLQEWVAADPRKTFRYNQLTRRVRRAACVQLIRCSFWRPWYASRGGTLWHGPALHTETALQSLGLLQVEVENPELYNSAMEK